MNNDLLTGTISRSLPKLLAMIVASSALLTGCDPRRLPGFREEAKRQQERITRETEAAIEKSPRLQELNHLCTEQIPRPTDFVSVNKYMSLQEERFLGYGYRSPSDYESVKTFYVRSFAERGWQLTRQKDDGWGPREIEFRKNGFQVTIEDVVRGFEINYFVHCARL